MPTPFPFLNFYNMQNVKILHLPINVRNLPSSLHVPLPIVFQAFVCFIQITCIWCCNTSLGLATKARACKVAGQERSLGVTSHVPRGAKSVREWILTLPNELPFSELESQWTSKSLEGDCKFQWTVLYIIGKLLKRRCLKWAHMTHLDIWNTNYG